MSTFDTVQHSDHIAANIATPDKQRTTLFPTGNDKIYSIIIPHVREDPIGLAVLDRAYTRKLQTMEQTLGKEHLNGTTMTSCRRTTSETTNGFSIDYHAACGDSSLSPTVFVYNPYEKERHLCGSTISPNNIIAIADGCFDRGHLFPTIPDIHGTDMPPVHARFINARGSPQPFPDCDIPCQESGVMSLKNQRNIEGTNWRITASMEGPHNYRELEIRAMEWKNDHFYSTSSYQSDIPLPYYNDVEYKIWDAEPVDFDQAIRGGVFLARNCHSRNHREKLIKDLSRLASPSQNSTQNSAAIQVGNATSNDIPFKVESVSKCEHNANLPPGATPRNKVSIMNKYLFYFAFENQCVPDYITEKLWGPLEAGTVPVYFGAPNVREHAPKNSLILVNDFPNTEALFQYLVKVANNKTLYSSYHEWRRLPQPDFDAKMKMTKTHGTCRTCRWAYARMYGLGWNHTEQSVQDLHIPRKTCIDGRTGLLHHPVVETWSDAASLDPVNVQPINSVSTSYNNCLAGDNVREAVTLGNDQVVRTVHQVDGVIDMDIALTSLSPRAWSNKMLLRLDTKLDAHSSVYQHVNPGHVRVQDARSRVTFLTWPQNITISTPMNHSDSVEFVVDKLPLRIRIISENVDTFHDGAESVENYFGKLMIEDFYNPLEFFYAPNINETSPPLEMNATSSL